MAIRSIAGFLVSALFNRAAIQKPLLFQQFANSVLEFSFMSPKISASRKQ
jgi:hypothetical protein